MLLVSKSVETLEDIGSELAASANSRDRNAEFSREMFDRVFSHPDFPRLDFSTRESHARSTLQLIGALQSIGRTSLDLPFISSLAAQAAIAPELVAKFASAEKRNAHLPKLQSGVDLAAICNSEEAGGTQLKTMTSRCVIDANGVGTMNVVKPIATNASGAGTVLVSAWEQRIDEVPTLQMYIVGVDAVNARAVASTRLSGFRTGNCGSLTITNAQIEAEECRLGSTAPPLAAFRHCFDFERLYLGSLVIGILDGLEALVLDRFKSRTSLHDKQFVQEKVIAITIVRAKLQALFGAIVARGFDTLHRSQIELSLLKWMCAEDVPAAIQQASDIGGWNSYGEDDTMNRVARDIAALRFFGGTVELQKMTIFSTVMSRKGSSV
ncbi:hypothetical protein BH10BDE1_BH10BDE1_22940 [soil metagenome]